MALAWIKFSHENDIFPRQTGFPVINFITINRTNKRFLVTRVIFCLLLSFAVFDTFEFWCEPVGNHPQKQIFPGLRTEIFLFWCDRRLTPWVRHISMSSFLTIVALCWEFRRTQTAIKGPPMEVDTIWKGNILSMSYFWKKLYKPDYGRSNRLKLDGWRTRYPKEGKAPSSILSWAKVW